jgi:hypothetical protein
MEAWAWLIAYLVGFALLQLFLYRYLQRGESTHDGGSERESREPGYKRLERSAMSETAVERSGDADGVYCRHCGARNERDGMYSYCRNCAEALR